MRAAPLISMGIAPPADHGIRSPDLAIRARRGGDASAGESNHRLVVESQDINWATTDVAPDSEGLLYDFADMPPKAAGSTTIVSLTDAVCDTTMRR